MSSWWPVPVIAEGALISDLRILEHEARQAYERSHGGLVEPERGDYPFRLPVRMVVPFA